MEVFIVSILPVSKIPRCGTIRAGINIDVDDDFNTLALKLCKYSSLSLSGLEFESCE
jgi:hypothetical protein